jgi:DNA repair protein RecO (recombination protein O)
MRSFSTEGIIIKRRNYGESDRIITIFTKYHGKLQIKASGVRKITSRRSAHVELLNHATVTLHTSSFMPVLTEATVIKDFSAIKEDLAKVGLAYHICELVDGLCPEGEQYAAVFELLQRTLGQLSGSYLLPPLNDNNTLSDNESYTTMIHEFEVELLTMLGYWHGKTDGSINLDTQNFIEQIIEKKLKSKKIFSKLH